MRTFIGCVMMMAFATSVSAKMYSTKQSRQRSLLGKEKRDRSVAFNASSNSGPRDIHTDISSNTRCIVEGRLPVIYYPWPEDITKVWQQDATIVSSEVLKIGEVTFIAGVVGHVESSYTHTLTEPTPFYNAIVIGSYMIPFTIGFNLNYNF